MSGAPVLTLHRRLGPGAELRRGSLSAYRAVTELEGEPHAVRADLSGVSAVDLRSRGRTLACIAHVTDLHVCDVQSPARFEFINREFQDPRFRELLPMQRPYEALSAHAIEAMVRTLNGIVSGPFSGSALELVAMTGDAIDNTQWNELVGFMDLFEGGSVNPGSGGPSYEGVQSPAWPDDIFWKPDGDATAPDLYVEAFGFPHVPGLLERALKPFRADGLRLPWLACRGNHEELNQGVGIVTPELAAALIGSRKPLRLAEGWNQDSALETFVARPHAYMAGPATSVTPDAARHSSSRHEYVDAHFRREARPVGHGFTALNRSDGTAYYSHDTEAVRFITLDTACPAGGAAGCLDQGQLHWLEAGLSEVRDRVVVILSHHGLDTLNNHRVSAGEDESHFVKSDELLRVLHRFDNVVLWLNGHIHANSVRPRIDPLRTDRGFWEVTTCSISDWPSQARIVELVQAGDGALVIACTMVDHDSPCDPGAAAEAAELASLHRQLAGNAPMAGFESGRAGTPLDRNVILPVGR